jgi:hypothetical protein
VDGLVGGCVFFFVWIGMVEEMYVIVCGDVSETVCLYMFKRQVD